MKPTLFLTLGVPGAGKTYFSKRFARDKELVHLNVDRLRLAIFEDPTYDETEHLIIFATMDHLAEQLLASGKGVIYDANLNKLRYRQEKYRLAKKLHVPFYLLYFKTSLELAEQRVVDREHEIPPEKHRDHPIELLRRLASELEEPTKAEPKIELIGSDDYAEKLAVVEQYLAQK